MQSSPLQMPKLGTRPMILQSYTFSSLAQRFGTSEGYFCGRKDKIPHRVLNCQNISYICNRLLGRYILIEVFCSIFPSKSGKFQVEKGRQSTHNLICRDNYISSSGVGFLFIFPRAYQSLLGDEQMAPHFLC